MLQMSAIVARTRRRTLRCWEVDAVGAAAAPAPAPTAVAAAGAAALASLADKEAGRPDACDT